MIAALWVASGPAAAQAVLEYDVGQRCFRPVGGGDCQQRFDVTTGSYTGARPQRATAAEQAEQADSPAAASASVPRPMADALVISAGQLGAILGQMDADALGEGVQAVTTRGEQLDAIMAEGEEPR